MADQHLYRVRFMGQDKLYEVYAEKVYQGDMYGFIVIQGLIFDKHTTVVVDPSEEKLKNEFEGVERTVIPMHAVVRIDEVVKKGSGKITDLSGKVTPFPSAIYTPKGSE